MRIGNDIVGKFKGIPVYKSNIVDYVNNRYYYDQENMYLIDGELIYKNEIFAKYDGNYVSELDAHLRSTFYTVPAIGGVKSTSSIGTEKGDTNSKSETKTEDTAPVSEFQPEDVEVTLSGVFDSEAIKGVYETDYFSLMTDIDAFLK